MIYTRSFIWQSTRMWDFYIVNFEIETRIKNITINNNIFVFQAAADEVLKLMATDILPRYRTSEYAHREPGRRNSRNSKAV